VRVVDGKAAYLRLRGQEDGPTELYELLKHVLRFAERPL
jgi:hypothetical protein